MGKIDLMTTFPSYNIQRLVFLFDRSHFLTIMIVLNAVENRARKTYFATSSSSCWNARLEMVINTVGRLYYNEAQQTTEAPTNAP